MVKVSKLHNLTAQLPTLGRGTPENVGRDSNVTRYLKVRVSDENVIPHHGIHNVIVWRAAVVEWGRAR